MFSGGIEWEYPSMDICTGCKHELPNGPADMEIDAMDPFVPMVLLCAPCAMEIDPDVELLL
jgi:hypothetical protein